MPPLSVTQTLASTNKETNGQNVELKPIEMVSVAYPPISDVSARAGPGPAVNVISDHIVLSRPQWQTLPVGCTSNFW